MVISCAKMSSRVSLSALHTAILQGDADTVQSACQQLGPRIHEQPLLHGRPALLVAAFQQNDRIQQLLLDDLLTYEDPKFRKQLLKSFGCRLHSLPENCYLRRNIERILQGVLDTGLFLKNQRLFLEDSRALEVWMEYVKEFSEERQDTEIRNIVVQSFKRGFRAIFQLDDWVLQHPTFRDTLEEIPQHLQAIFQGNLVELEAVLEVNPNWQHEKFQFTKRNDMKDRVQPPIEDLYISDPIGAFDLTILTDDDKILDYLITKSETVFTQEILENLLNQCAHFGSRKCLDKLFSLPSSVLSSAWNTKWSPIVQIALKRQNFETAVRILNFLTPPYHAEYYYLWKFVEKISGFEKTDPELKELVRQKNTEYSSVTSSASTMM